MSAKKLFLEAIRNSKEDECDRMGYCMRIDRFESRGIATDIISEGQRKSWPDFPLKVFLGRIYAVSLEILQANPTDVTESRESVLTRSKGSNRQKI